MKGAARLPFAVDAVGEGEDRGGHRFSGGQSGNSRTSGADADGESATARLKAHAGGARPGKAPNQAVAFVLLNWCADTQDEPRQGVSIIVTLKITAFDDSDARNKLLDRRRCGFRHTGFQVDVPGVL